MELPFMIDLKDKVAVVTGGGGILCAMFAEAIASCGAKVALFDLDEGSAQNVANKITDQGNTAKGYPCDVLDKASIEEAYAQVKKDFGTCDILINGAGGNNPRATTDKEYFEHGDIESDIKSFFDLESKGIQFVFNLNFLGTLLTTQVIAKDMVEKNSALILNISSMNAFTPLTKIPAYSGAKAAISNFTQWLAVHFSKTSIRVNAIAPGFFVTKQNQDLLYDEAGNPTPRTDKILAATPIGRFGEPRELLGTLLWLLSDRASSFVTGVVIPVDGGFSAYSGV